MPDEQKIKKRHWPRNLVIITIIVVLCVTAIAAVGLLLSKKAAVKPGTVLEITLTGAIAEGPSSSFLSELTGGDSLSIWGIRRSLRAAASDPNIVGLRVLIQTPSIGWGAAEEILREMDKFRESKKPIYVLCQSDVIGDIDYFLATGGDRIWISPETGVLINGLTAEYKFWRGSLDKLKIEPEVIMYKEYKSAGEPYLNKKMSPYMREATTALLNNVESCFKERVTKMRGIDPKAYEDLLDRGMTTTNELLRMGFVDKQGYLDEVEKAFEKISDVGKYRGLKLSAYLSSLQTKSYKTEKTIAVVFGEGAILAQKVDGFGNAFGDYIFGPVLAKNIKDAADDERVKAIVLRVNSPGGSAVGSDVVNREVERAVAMGKPVIVSMSTVAGSGGYWISMHANAIVAEPTTITGSIGVVFTKFNITGFLDWIGVNVDTVTTHKYADLMGYAPLDDDRKKLVMGWMDDVYNSFVKKVAEGRNLKFDETEKIARGRVWSGNDAIKIKLIDRLGGMDEAIAMAKEKAKLDTKGDYPLVVFPKHKTFMQRLLSGELFAGTPEIPTKADIIEFATEMARPSMLVQMPDIKIQ
jgi:protease IV